MVPSERIFGTALTSAALGWLVASLLLFGFFAAFAGQGYDDRAVSLVFGFMIVAGSLPVALISTFVLGVLWHLEAQKRHLTKMSAYWLPGMMIGGLVATVVPLITLAGINTSWASLIALGTIYGAVCGGVTGLSAWLILRPDRDLPNPDLANAQSVDVGSAALDPSQTEQAQPEQFPEPLRSWIRIFSIAFFVVTAVLVLWVVLASPR